MLDCMFLPIAVEFHNTYFRYIPLPTHINCCIQQKNDEVDRIPSKKTNVNAKCVVSIVKSNFRFLSGNCGNKFNVIN